MEIAMRWLSGLAGTLLLAVVLWDAFETIILPRRVSGRIRLTKLFYRSTWMPWRGAARLLSGWRRDRVLVRRVHERHDFLYARPWGRGAARHGREGAYRGGGGNGVRLSRGGHRVFSGDLSGVFAPRGRDLIARRSRGLTAQRLGVIVAAPGRSRHGGPDRPAARLGALGGRCAREPPVVSAARLLQVAALQRVVARRAHDDPGRERGHHRGTRGVVCAPGGADVRHGAPRGRGPGAGVQHAAATHGGASLGSPAGQAPGAPGERGTCAPIPARLRAAAHRAAPHVRAVRRSAGAPSRGAAAAVGARGGAA